MTIERAMTGGAYPTRAMPRPIAVAAAIARVGSIAGFVATVAGAAGPEIFFAAAEAAEAEAAIGQRNRPVGIAFAGRDRVAQPRDQEIAHQNFRHNATGGLVRQRYVDRDDGRASEPHPPFHFLIAAGSGLLRRPVGILKRPGAGRFRRHRAGEQSGDAVLARRQIGFALAVALTDFDDFSGLVETEPVEHAKRPA